MAGFAGGKLVSAVSADIVTVLLRGAIVNRTKYC